MRWDDVVWGRRSLHVAGCGDPTEGTHVLDTSGQTGLWQPFTTALQATLANTVGYGAVNV